MQHIVVISGAGISAESGISTFRDSDGLWNNYRIEDVATFDAWIRNRNLVLEFYNARRKQLYEVKPNTAHFELAKLETHFKVSVVTQNVDDLHERAGSKNVLHLHGELKKVRSTLDENLVYQLNGWELKEGDFCEKGSQLRPHIVWFGEQVPMIVEAQKIVETADMVLVVGTSLQVYPAAGLLSDVRPNVPIYLIDPAEVQTSRNVTHIKAKATEGVLEFVKQISQKS